MHYITYNWLIINNGYNIIIKMKFSLQLCPGISLLQRTRTICQYATLMKSNGIVYRKINLTIVKVVWLSRLHDQTHCVNNIVCTLLFDGTVCNTNNSGMSDQKAQNIDKIVLLSYLGTNFSSVNRRKKKYEQTHSFIFHVQLNSKNEIYGTC